jgi:hypothetical protein
MHRQESDDETDVLCHGIDPKPFRCRVAHPDVAGEYCFPAMASLITSAARLMLAPLEDAVAQRGGTYAMGDMASRRQSFARDALDCANESRSEVGAGSPLSRDILRASRGGFCCLVRGVWQRAARASRA